MENMNALLSRALLSAIPTALVALDSSENIIFANPSASRLLSTPRNHLIGGPLARYTNAIQTHSSTPHIIKFSTSNGDIELLCASKDILIEDDVYRILLLKAPIASSNSITDLIIGFDNNDINPFEYICKAIIDLDIAKDACIRVTSSTQCDIVASTTDNTETFSSQPSIARTISKDESTHSELVVIPQENIGLTSQDITTIDMFISLLHLRIDTSESESDASGSEAALALALKAGDMGMCFLDTQRAEVFLSDQLATWCSIDLDHFSGTLNAWLATFRQDDRTRVGSLFNELDIHNKFKTIVHIATLEGDIRLELTGRPLHEKSQTQWVVIAQLYSDEAEVQHAWQTRIAMEESARIQAEQSLETFEETLVATLLPTTSDVSINQSRQDAGTWHIVRPIDSHTCIYALGAVTASSRTQAIVDATICATMADVIATYCDDVELFVGLLKDHGRARDIETTIASVKVVNNSVSAMTHGGASVYISGKPFIGTQELTANTALSLSTHSVASPETIDVAADGRPWKIMTTVIDVPQYRNKHNTTDEDSNTIDLTDDINEAEPKEPIITGRVENISQFKSGSINPN